MQSMKEKVVLITGAGGGIGKATAIHFVKAGAFVHLVDTRAEVLQQLASDLGPRASYSVADVADEAATSTYFEDIQQRYSRLDVAFLNAGIMGQISEIAEMPVQQFDQVLRVNVRGVWLGLAQSLRAMKAQGSGSIVITSSIAGQRGTAGQGAYVTSKHAVLGMMKSAALEGAEYGVRVNAICPAPIDTEMMADLVRGINTSDPELGKQRIISGIPLGRYGRAEEVANLVGFLASDDASYCTGSAFMIDGGGSAGPVRKISK